MQVLHYSNILYKQPQLAIPMFSGAIAEVLTNCDQLSWDQLAYNLQAR